MGAEAFWQALDALVAASALVIDRPKGTAHPRYPALVYPLDYGFLEGTASMDGGGIDVWRGSHPETGLGAILVTVDLFKRDSEIKLLLGCTETETRTVYAFHNESSLMRGALVRRQPPADALHGLLRQNSALYAALLALRDFPFPYYAGAGAVAQTVWNLQCGNDPSYGIDDMDIAYHDPDTGYGAEDAVIRMWSARLSALPLRLDIKNQARVHLWYPDRFGREIAPYASVEDAIRTWPTTATAVGVRLRPDDTLEVFAPFGLDDLFAQTVRPNKAQITEAIYLAKVAKWTAKWPGLAVVPW